MQTNLPYTLELHIISKKNPNSKYAYMLTAFKGRGPQISICALQRA